MNAEKISGFQSEMLEFLKLYHEKLARPSEGLLQRTVSPLQFYALCIIRDGRPAMNEIAQKLRLPKQHVTKIVDKLEELKLVRRVQGEGDRRITRVEMSPQAETFFKERVHEQLGELCRRVDGLGEIKAEEFRQLVRRMNVLLDEMPGESGDVAR